MKWVRMLARLVLISLAAAAFVVLAGLYANSMWPDSVNPSLQAREHRPSGPNPSRFPSFIGEGILFALLTAAGRIVFRLRLSAVSRSEERMISLDLYRTHPERLKDK